MSDDHLCFSSYPVCYVCIYAVTSTTWFTRNHTTFYSDQSIKYYILQLLVLFDDVLVKIYDATVR